MEEFFLFMALLGCKPPGRFTEQHDIFFGVGRKLGDLQFQMERFWPEAPKVHIDSWRKVTNVDGYAVKIIRRTNAKSAVKLFFINLGGYKPDDFEEYHYKVLVAAADVSEAVRLSKRTAFFRHTGFEGAVAHVDDKYGIDVDDILNVEDVLSAQYKDEWQLVLTPSEDHVEDELHIGYVPMTRIAEQ